MCKKDNNCHQHCNQCIQQSLGQISGELLGTDKIALIQDGKVIGSIPIISGQNVDILDAFGNIIPG